MTTFHVAETFTSINGEGTHAGQLAVFVRFCGCNLNCSFCDTTWANELDVPYVCQTTEEICASVDAAGVHNVTLTGGEPLLRGGMTELLTALSQKEPIYRNRNQRQRGFDTVCRHLPVYRLHDGLQAARQRHGSAHAHGKFRTAPRTGHREVCRRQSGGFAARTGGYSNL